MLKNISLIIILYIILRFKINKIWIKEILNINLVIIIMYISFIYFIIYNSNNNEYQYREIYEVYYIKIITGIDGINLPLILITTIITPIILYIQEKYNKEKEEGLGEKIIILELIIIILFIVLDIFYFYTLFECILIPMFIIILKFGSRYKKIEASYRFFIYTLIGSLLFLIGIIIINIKYGTTNNEILELHLNNEIFSSQFILWFLLFISFAIKIPIYPFHLWLPEAHTEAPTTGSILLAAILLKLGIFGLIRFNINFFNYINIYLSPIIFILSIISIIYSCYISLRLLDLKKIIAYSSIIHMNYVIISLYTYNINSIIGSYYTIITHAFISSALFYLIGVIYRRYFTKNILYLRGLSNIMPIFSIILFYFILSNISFPLTSAFPGELLILFGILKDNIWIGFILLLLLFITTSYNFIILNKLLFGNLSIYLKSFLDLSLNEFYTLFPFILFNLFLGLFSSPLINIFLLSLSKSFLL